MSALLAALLALAGPAPAPDRFVPPTHVEAGRVVVPLTFTDGTRAELSYPPRLRLAQRGLEPYGSGELRGAGARDFQILFGDVEDVMARAHHGARLLKRYAAADGGTVGLWETPRRSVHRLYLAFQFAGWTVLVYDYPSTSDGGAASLSDAERARWARSMSGRATAAGFLRLQGGGRLRLARAGDHAGPQLAFGGSGGPLTLTPGRCRRTRDHDRRMGGRWVSWSRTFASWCLSPAMRADVHAGGRRWMRSLIRHLDVRAVHPSGAYANMCSCVGKIKLSRSTSRAGYPGSRRRR